MHTNKIVSLDDLAQIAQTQRQQGQKLVLCHGCFDLLHIGHIRYLTKARRFGDQLIVTLTADAFVNKGPGRPVFPEVLRAEHMAALSMVDYVAINYAETAINVIEALKPHFYVKGDEYETDANDITGNIAKERQAVERHGGEICFTHEATFSSSQLLNRNFSLFPPETEQYLQGIRQRYHADEIIQRLEELSHLKIAVIGDAIIDEYHYTQPLGQTGKGNVLAVKYGSAEKFAGGAIAVANHLASFAQQVTLFTGLGSYNSEETFIRDKLLPNVTPNFIYFNDAPTLVKRRYIDEDTTATKLFEVYFYKENAGDEALQQRASTWIEQHLAQFDLVVVPDFGNGFIGKPMIAAITEHAKFLAVNTQINSGNRGYHVITRYPRADFISLNEPELRLASYDRQGDLWHIAAKIKTQLNARQVAITRGTHGAWMLSQNNTGQFSQYKSPALSTHVVDRIGAGDTFLSLASLCLAGGIESELSLFVASTAAALDVQIVCNREPINPISLFKYINTLLK